MVSSIGIHLHVQIVKISSITVFSVFMTMFLLSLASGADLSEKETWWVHDDFNRLSPKVIAVLPMDNFSLEPHVEEALYGEVYDRLQAKGYRKISVDKVHKVMKQLGIQTPGQVAGISPDKLGKLLNCDALLLGRIDQSASIHDGIYSAAVVSCSLRLMQCKTGTILWKTEQWRAAHRQWAIDPINLFINFATHENASREERVAWLAHEMLKTLPQGAVKVKFGDLLNQAQEIRSNTK